MQLWIFRARTVTVPFLSFTLAPSDSRMRAMNRVSLRSGTPWMTHGSLVNNAAAMMGNEAFLLPLIEELVVRVDWDNGAVVVRDITPYVVTDED